MSSTPRAPGFAEVALTGLHIGRAVRAPTWDQLILSSNDLLLARPSGRWSAYGLKATAGPFRLPLRTDLAPRFVRLDVRLRDTAAGVGTVKLSVAVTDGTTTVGPSDPAIPALYQNSITAPIAVEPGLIPPRAWVPPSCTLDLEAIASEGLIGGDWFLIFAPTLTGFTTPKFDLVLSHYPRDWVDDSLDAGGCVTTSVQQYLPVAAGDAISTPYVDGIARVFHGMDVARWRPNVALSLQWPDDTSASLPTVTDHSGSPVVITNFNESGNARSFAGRVRRMGAGSATGEPHRWRIRYKMSGGTTETCTVKMYTGASGSPFATTLPHATSWTWSAWQTGAYLRTTGGGANQYDALSFKATNSGAGAVTTYISGIDVESDPT